MYDLYFFHILTIVTILYFHYLCKINIIEYKDYDKKKRDLQM